MARKRNFEKEKQTKFAKEHYHLNNAYLTDVDGIEVSSTENELYMQYSYNTTFNGVPLITKLIEVKHNASSYIKNMIKKEIKPNSQIAVYCRTVEEINQSRGINELPSVEFWLIVQSNGDYPFHVFNVFQDVFDDVEFERIKTVNNKQEYIALFEPK